MRVTAPKLAALSRTLLPSPLPAAAAKIRKRLLCVSPPRLSPSITFDALLSNAAPHISPSLLNHVSISRWSFPVCHCRAIYICRGVCQLQLRGWSREGYDQLVAVGSVSAHPGLL